MTVQFNFQHLTSYNPLMVMGVPFPTISSYGLPITTDWVFLPQIRVTQRRCLGKWILEPIIWESL